MAPLFTILLPITRPPVFMPFAIETVQAQTISQFELFIVCDGAPPETVQCAEQYARNDSRIRVFPFEKGERHGELHRHAALQSASGPYIAAIEDDDLWFPNHLEAMQRLLDAFDFGNVLHAYVDGAGSVRLHPSDLGSAEFRESMLNERFNRIGETFCGYRLGAYRSLPVGWDPSPPGFWPDLHMWRKFLRAKDLKFGTRNEITAISLPSHLREMSTEARAAECRAWRARVADVREREAIAEAAWQSLVRVALPNDALEDLLAQAIGKRDGLGNELHLMTRSRDHWEVEASALSKQRDYLKEEADKLRESRDYWERDATEREKRRNALEEQGRTLRAERDRLEMEFGKLKLEADRLRDHCSALNRERERVIAERTQLEEMVLAIRSSTSWRATEPLRKLSESIRGLLKVPGNR